MTDPFSMKNVAAMAGLPQQGHNIVIESIDRFGVTTLGGYLAESNDKKAAS